MNAGSTPSQASFNPTDEEKTVMPWMYIGYPGFCQWSGHSEDSLVVRRFDSLAARTVIYAQWELSELEKNLALMDHNRAEGARGAIHNGRFSTQDDDLTHHLGRIRSKLESYCTIPHPPNT